MALRAQYIILANDVQDLPGGKVNLLGLFDRVWPPTVPAVLERMVISVLIVTDNEDGLGKHTFKVEVRAPTKGPVAQLGAAFELKLQGGSWVAAHRMNFNIRGIPIPEYGKHRIIVYVDDEVLGEHPLSAMPPEKRGR